MVSTITYVAAVNDAGKSRVRSPMVSLEYFIDIILPVALLALGSTHPITSMRTSNISQGGGLKAAGA